MLLSHGDNDGIQRRAQRNVAEHGTCVNRVSQSWQLRPVRGPGRSSQSHRLR